MSSLQDNVVAVDAAEPSALPVEPPESVVIDEPLELLATTPSVDEATNHYERCSIRIAQPGHPIARILHPELVKLGSNTQLLPDGQTIIATIAGRVRVRGGCIWIDKVLEISGDVDFATGCIEFDKDVIVHGSVLDLFKVTAGGSIRVDRAVEAAEVRAGQDLLVGGGIVGKEKGRCYAGHDVRAKHISNAWVEAGNDVIVEREITHSRIICSGRLLLENGVLLAGHITATAGIKCRVLGSPGASGTVIEAGIDEALCRLTAESVQKIEADLQRIAKTREAVEPLMRNPKILTATQKEKATELLYQCSEAEEQNKRTLEQLKKKRDDAAAKANAEILVTAGICAGVIIRFPGLEAVVTSSVKGSLRLVPRDFKTERRIVVERAHGGGSAFALDTHPLPDPTTLTLNRLLSA